jgi:long-chain acyl-CoA synthetase
MMCRRAQSPYRGGVLVTQITKAELDEAVAGQTITSRFLETIESHPDQVALRAKEGDDWVQWTYREYADKVARAVTYLQGLGIAPGDRVVLMMRNIPEFHFLDTAALYCGATPISIYNSSSPDQVQYLVGHCKAKLALVENDGFEERFSKVIGELPALEQVVNLSVDGASDQIFGGEAADLQGNAGNCSPDSLATVIYTSGTTGPPKGVMLSHYNVVWTAEGYMGLLDVEPVGFRAVSYLPMAHIAERMSTHYLAMLGGYEVTTCPDPSLIAEYARAVKPEIMFGVPRVWEKVHAGVQGALAADPEKKQKFDEAVAAARPIAERRTLGTATKEDEETWSFLDAVAFSTVRELIGLDEMKFAVTGAAPIPPDLIAWYRAIGVPLSEIYGMSESSGPMTWEPYRVKAGTVGKAFPGTEVFLAEDGEVCTRGGNVFLGYLDDPEKTADALDDDGTLHSGDIGVFDDEGYLRIVDRKKELIITAGGKNISPANLEANLKSIPIVGQACAIGDQRPFVSALIVLDGEVAPAWAKDRGIEFDSLADLAQHPEVEAEVNRGVEEAMSEFNNAERVKKVTILSEEWMPDSEELTPTSKLKRRGIHAKYADEIEAMYAR